MENLLISNIETLMLKREINGVELSRLTDIPQPTISRILNGTSTNPRHATLKKIAAFFEVPLERLCFERLTTSTDSVIQIPVLDKNTIADWLNGNKKISPNHFVPTNRKLSTQSFAIHHYEHIPLSYFKQKQTLLIFDPNITPKDGDLILLKLSNHDDIIIRQIIIDLADQYTKSLNPKLNMPGHLNKINTNDRILATLVQVIIDSR